MPARSLAATPLLATAMAIAPAVFPHDAASVPSASADSYPNVQIVFVLGGFSQGAAVIDIIAVAANPILGFTDPMPTDVADHVATVAVLGNPSNRISGPLTTLSPLYGDKTIDLCNGADPVCSDGDDVGAHSLYVQSGMANQAASFAAHLI